MNRTQKNNEVNTAQLNLDKALEVERERIKEYQTSQEYLVETKKELAETKKKIENEMSLPKEEFFKREINKQINEYMKSK